MLFSWRILNPMAITIFSWNINGFRAGVRNGFLEWLQATKPDIACLQETKCSPEDLPANLVNPRGYTSLWHSAVRAGYSGTAVFFKKENEPFEVSTSVAQEFDAEGRVQILYYSHFVLINAYFPNSQPERKRLAYKLAFNNTIRQIACHLVETGQNVIVCGDFNVAHTEIDLARPEENRNNPGFYPEECASMQTFLDAGFVDVFRAFHPGEKGHYTWWSYRTRARERNIGWRLDYYCVNTAFFNEVKQTKIWAEILGSDHCPVSLTLK